MSTETSTKAQPAAQNADRRPTSDVPFLKALALATPLYGVAVLLARVAPAGAREILLERGWVCHAIMALSCLALTILFLKGLALRAQRGVFSLPILPAEEAQISADNIQRVLAHVNVIRARVGARRGPRSFLVERAYRVLTHYAARYDAAEAAAAANAEAEADAASSASSFSVVKIMVWAIPILGFIGTVIGIGDAVGGFSRSLDGAGQLDTIKSALGDVTSGLAVAFDTTLVALVASIFVMVPTSWVQKAEDQLLGDVDDHCVTLILPRLTDGAAQQADASLPHEAIRKLLADVVAAPLAEMGKAQAELLERLAADQKAAQSAQSAAQEQLRAFALAAEKIAPAILQALAGMERTGEQLERAVAQIAGAQSHIERATNAATRAAEEVSAAGKTLATRLVKEQDAQSAFNSSVTQHLSALTAASERMAAGAEGSAQRLEQASTVAEKASIAAERAHDQLCRELGASRQLLTLLAAGMGGNGAAHSAHAG